MPTTKKVKKIILLSILSIIAFSVVVGYFLYNKPAMDVQHSPAKKISAAALYELFTKDSVEAKKNYIEKIVQVTGEVKHIFQNQQKQWVILLASGISGAFVNCTMEGPNENIKNGTMVSIKGICSGIVEGDADWGIPGDAYLIRCYETK